MNTRETAILIWLLIFIVWAIRQKKIRRALVNLARAFFRKKIIGVVTATIIYTLLVVFVLWNLGIWRFSLIKDTIFWLIGTAIISLINANKAAQGQGFFKNILLDNLKLVLVVEYIVNLFTFSLVVELLLVPIVSIVILLSVFTEMKKEYIAVKKLADFVLASIGFVLIAYSLARVLKDFQYIASSESMSALVLPPLLTLSYIPFLYLFALVIAYENLFFRVDFFIKDSNGLKAQTKRKIMRLCHVNLYKLIRFTKASAGDLANIDNMTLTRGAVMSSEMGILLGSSYKMIESANEMLLCCRRKKKKVFTHSGVAISFFLARALEMFESFLILVKERRIIDSAVLLKKLARHGDDPGIHIFKRY